MVTLGIKDNVVRLLDTLGLVQLLRLMRGFENFTYEFLSSLAFTKDRSKSDNPDHRVSFWLLNVDYEMSLEKFCLEMVFTNAGYIHDSWDHSLKPADYDPIAFWKSIIGLEQYNVRSNKASNIHNPVLRYLQRVIIFTIWGRKEVGATRTDEMFMLWEMLNNRLVNTCYYLLDYLVYVARKKADEKNELVVGGNITFIVRKMGVSEESGLNKIEGNNKLHIDTLVSMFIIRPYGPHQNYTYELRANRAQCLIILPNSTRTDTGVVENLLYVGANPQVQEDHGDDGDNEQEEGGHLQDDPVHHDQEASGQYDNDWWAWMQRSAKDKHRATKARC